MADPLEPFLRAQGVLVLDGGLATELERHGADLRDALWSARLLRDDPDLIRDVHRAYLEAGADVVTTASYQASVDGFAGVGVSRAHALDLIRRSVALARDACALAAAGHPGRLAPMVAGSVGPYGAALADGSEYRGHYGLAPAALAAWHRPRLAALAEAGADLLALETIPSALEARVLVDLLAEWPEAAAWVTFSCRDEEHVSEGQPIESAIALVEDSPQVVAVGVNCVAPALVDGLLARVRRATSKPLVVYPNSGERWDAAARGWRAAGRGYVPAVDAPRWHAAGARLIGGCCRTTPDTVAALRRAFSGTVPT